MADITVKGEELTVDLEKITIDEFGDFAQGRLLSKEDHPVIARIINKPVDYVKTLSPVDYMRVVRAILDTWKTLINNPN